MFRVDVDDSEVEQVAVEATAALRQVPRILARAGSDAAQRSRREHLYRNRTGAAQASTQAVSQNDGDTAYTTVQIAVPYASYLRDRSVDLTAVEDAVEQMERELDYAFAGLGDQISRL
jgi:hypothetical protein